MGVASVLHLCQELEDTEADMEVDIEVDMEEVGMEVAIEEAALDFRSSCQSSLEAVDFLVF